MDEKGKNSERKGYRLTRIYTRSGDAGATRIGNGKTLSKSSERIEAIGQVDELNSWIGLLLNALEKGGEVSGEQLKQLSEIQHRLFDVGGELAMPDCQLIQKAFVTQLEQLLDELNEPLPPLKNFTLPGGSQTACYCHMARTVSRRAERAVVRLNEAEGEIGAALMAYLNRLSDLMYVLARHVARQSGEEVLWQPAAR